MEKHTPGTWSAGTCAIEPGCDAPRHLAIVNEKAEPGKVIALTGLVGDDDEAQSMANTQLIAAAPDLLEALQGVLRVADRVTDEFDAARAAIKKATGAE